MVSLKPLLLMCLLVVGAHMQDLDISVDITIESYKDPCDNYQCPIGEKCQPMFTPKLIKFPVAHCVNLKQDKEGACVEYIVNTNILNCKTAIQWEKVGQNQCTLRGDQSRITLSHTEMQFRCHSMTPEAKYLTAIVTCCLPPTTAVTETNSPSSPSPKYQEVPDAENVASPSSPTEWSINDSLVPVLLGAVAIVVIIGLVFFFLIVCGRSKLARQRSNSKPKMMVATSFVNPSVDHQDSYSDWVFNPLDSTDKSLLIVNEAPRE